MVYLTVTAREKLKKLAEELGVSQTRLLEDVIDFLVLLYDVMGKNGVDLFRKWMKEYRANRDTFVEELQRRINEWIAERDLKRVLYL